MLKTIWGFLSFILILVIFLRLPRENTGLSTFLQNNNTSTEQNLNYILGLIIICYLGLTFYLN